MKFGITLKESGGDPAGQARKAEDLGFDSVWAGEHVVWRHPIQDSLMQMAAAAAVTERIELGTAIVLIPLKHPILMCKAVTTLDHLSGGRVKFGIGIGGEYTKEFEAMGVPVNERGPRANEIIRLMKRLWTEESVTFSGRFYQLEDVGLKPQPVQKPHPPIYVGGRRKSVRRTALYGDGWIPYMYSPELFREGWGQIVEIAEGAGRDPKEIEPTVWVPICIDDDYDAAARMSSQALGGDYGQSFDEIVRRYALLGTPEQIVARMGEYRDAGVEHFIFSPSGPEEVTAEMPERIAREVIPLFGGG